MQPNKWQKVQVWHKLNKHRRAYVSASNTSKLMAQWLSGMQHHATNYFVIGLHWIGLSIKL
jgi:hypothetical protein